MSIQQPDLLIRTGALVAHRLLDVAYAIDLGRAEALWRARAGGASRTQLSRAATHELAFEEPPVLLALPSLEIEIDGQPLQAAMTARLYDIGAIVLSLRIEVSDLPWAAFAARCNALDRATGASSDTSLWRDSLGSVLEVIGPALHRPSTEHLEEDYLFAIAREFAEPITAAELRTRPDLAALLSGETRALSAQESADITRQAFSYFADDLAVVTWDRAFVWEPRGETDVIDIIEIANAQLLEMRYYDRVLNNELDAMYDLVENTHGSALSLLASRRAARLARKLHGLVAEVTELTEKVENALHVTEDVYLARIYGAALELFRVPRRSAAVNHKLAIIRDTCAALYDEASSRRAELLELAIVLLIVFEIVLALAGRG